MKETQEKGRHRAAFFRYTQYMQKIALVSIGRLREPWAREASDEYAKRIRAWADLEILELAPSKGRTADAQKLEESDRMLMLLQKTKGTVWILDETGKSFTSPAFSVEITAARDRGDQLTFLLGGSYGFTDAVRRAGRTIRLSDMTLPHELCRVLFLEQLYRAGEIAKGSGYHHQ